MKHDNYKMYNNFQLKSSDKIQITITDHKPPIDVPGDVEMTPAHSTTVNNVNADSVIVMSCNATASPWRHAANSTDKFILDNKGTDLLQYLILLLCLCVTMRLKARSKSWQCFLLLGGLTQQRLFWLTTVEKRPSRYHQSTTTIPSDLGS